MEALKVRVVKEINSKTLFEFSNVVIRTCNEDKMSFGNNMLKIECSNLKSTLISFNDVRLNYISRLEAMSFIGYTTDKYVKVIIYIWTK